MTFRNNFSLIALGASFIIIASLLILFLTKNKPSTMFTDDNFCIKGGCSGQLCINKEDANNMTTCEWKEIYKCYRLATCEKQANGKCGFTSNPEFTKCLHDNR